MQEIGFVCIGPLIKGDARGLRDRGLYADNLKSILST